VFLPTAYPLKNAGATPERIAPRPAVETDRRDVTSEGTALWLDVNAEFDDVTVSGNALSTGQVLNLFIQCRFRKKQYRGGALS
jgi:hypothetical protein